MTDRTPTEAAYDLGHDVGYRDALDHALMMIKRVWRGTSTSADVETDLQSARDAVQRVLDDRARDTEPSR